MPSSTNTNNAPPRAGALARQIQIEWRLVTVVLLLLTVLLVLFRHELRISQIDRTLYDLQMKLATPTPVDQSIALVVIDDGSLKELGYWPWRRAEHAKLLEKLPDAKAVGFDIVFQDLNPAYPEDDQVFADALAAHGRAVLPLIVQPDFSHAELPLPILAKAANQLGFINIFPEPDGVVRRFHLRLDTHDGQNWQHLITAMLRAGGDTTLADELATSPDLTRLIPFSGNHGHFDTYSYAAVLAGHYPPDTFKNRYVLVGAWSSGLGDAYPTPMSWEDHSSMTGVEILANGLSNAQQRHWIQELHSGFVILLSLIPIYLVCVILLRLTPRLAFIATVSLILAIFIMNWLFLHILKVWAPPTASFLVIMLAYPIWHWRSQETVLRNVNQELVALSHQHPSVRRALQAKAPTETVPARLSFLHQGMELLRDAQQHREQTLRFISHDMRAPQNSILALIAMQRSDAKPLDVDKLLEQVQTYANTTLELVDNFMDLAHAEAVEMEFQEINIADILVEVCDECWSRAHIKGISVQFDEPEEPVWIQANQPMLKRAFANLIDNAIKYSASDTQVQCTLHTHDGRVIIRIQDQGWGIPPELQKTIFQAFHRAHAQDTNTPHGSGIGLAFVETVIHRHQGRITLESEVGRGSTFTVSLPLAPITL